MVKTKVEIKVTTGGEVHKKIMSKYKDVINFVNKDLPAIVKNQEWVDGDQ
ncbi:hypothetical protein LCGC14_0844000 [marine sediment metagenome]|uniref:Uncharacterized protein n=1 Tax=marine sediment metagenome TaxID=412755 RepID=A0A0F9PC93_9ZZZZ